MSLDESNKIINFTKGINKYKLSYKPIEGDLLYPVVVLYYPEDSVEVLPDLWKKKWSIKSKMIILA